MEQPIFWSQWADIAQEAENIAQNEAYKSSSSSSSSSSE